MKLLVATACLFLAASAAFALDLNSTLSDGWRYFNNGNYNGASKTFESAARVFPDNAEAYKGQGMCFMKLGYSEYSTDLESVEKAATNFKKALLLDPNMQDVRFQLGLACLALDDKPCAQAQHQALSSSSNALADQLAKKISDYKPPKNYQLVSETIIESGGSTRSRMSCAPGETWNSYTNTCARSETPGEVAERYSREEIARKQIESRERIAQEEQKLMKKMMRSSHSMSSPPPIPSPPKGGLTGSDGTFYAPAGNGYINTRTGEVLN